eukprot:gb/GECH01012575.1/.p1 GENE.gb/GECH01012575.1/~~gb/GECH01012575.1/.p1  ORF type:complete len:522 (+),score=103.63 gb/GECH01012575.1/:1-1566(+)
MSQFDYTSETLDSCDWGYPDDVVNSTLNQGRVIGLGVVCALFLLAYLFCLVLFFIRRNKFPLKERSPYLTLVTMISAFIALIYMFCRAFLDLIFICPISYYFATIFFMTTFIPYILRCYRTLKLYQFNEAKANTLDANNNDTERYSQSLVKPNEEEMKTKEKTENDKSEEKDSDNEGANKQEHNREASLEDFEKDLFKDVDTVEQEMKDVSITVRQRPGYLLESDQKLRSIVNQRSRWTEGRLLIYLTIFTVIWIIVLGAIHGGLSTSLLDAGCQRVCINSEGWALRIVIFCSLAGFFFWGYFTWLLRKKNDEYGVRNELILMLVVSLCVLVPCVILAIIPGEFWPESPVAGYLLGVYLFLVFCVSLVYPLLKTWNWSRIFASKDSDDRPFDFFLTDSAGRECFKQFLIREFSVENLLFWIEVEQFKKVSGDEMNQIANQIFETYIMYGSAFEINIDDELSAGIRERIHNGNISSDMFDEVQDYIYHAMQADSFERFKQSNLYKNFMAQNPSSRASVLKFF